MMLMTGMLALGHRSSERRLTYEYSLCILFFIVHYNMCEDPVHHVYEDVYYLYLKGIQGLPRKMVPDGPVVKNLSYSVKS